MIDCSKGVRKVYLSEDQLLKKSCGHESFKLDLESSKNLIVTLRPYIQGPKKGLKGAIETGKKEDDKNARL